MLLRPIGRTRDFDSWNRGSNPRGADYAGVAQLVEQLICNEKVEGSSPFTSLSLRAKMDFLEKLEKFKSSGYYGVAVWYGEGVGCDDSDVPTQERRLRIIAYPVGVIGEVKIMFSGNVKQFLDFDFTKLPKQCPNPPDEEDKKMMDKGGLFMWGIEDSIKHLIKIWPTLQGKAPA